MLFSSLIVLLAASSFVNSLPTWHRRQLFDVAAAPSLDRIAPRLGFPPTEAGLPDPIHNTVSTAAAGKKDKVEEKLGDQKKGKKHANANAGNSTVTMTVTVTDAAGAANTITAGDAGETSTVAAAVTGTTSDSLSATLTSPPVASTSSVSDVAGGDQDAA